MNLILCSETELYLCSLDRFILMINLGSQRSLAIGACILYSIVAASCLIQGALIIAHGFEASARPLTAGGFSGPFNGWSSFSMQTYTPYNVMSQSGLSVQASMLAQSEFLQAGFNYFNLDSGWSGLTDDFGRFIPDPNVFPDGFDAFIASLQKNSLKLGIYFVPGVDCADRQNSSKVVKGTTYKISDISTDNPNANRFQGARCKIDFTQPGAQTYMDSVVELYQGFGVKFIKMDGLFRDVTRANPTNDTRPDIIAMRNAINNNDAEMWLTGSWHLSFNNESLTFWNTYLDAFRIELDVETYTNTPLLTDYPAIVRNVQALCHVIGNASESQITMRAYYDLDSLLVASPQDTSMTTDQRKLAYAVWFMAGGPLYLGDDLTKMDELGMQLMWNAPLMEYRASMRQVKYLSSDSSNPSRFTDQHYWYTTRQGDKSILVACTNTANDTSELPFSDSVLTQLGFASGQVYLAIDVLNLNSVISYFGNTSDTSTGETAISQVVNMAATSVGMYLFVPIAGATSVAAAQKQLPNCVVGSQVDLGPKMLVTSNSQIKCTNSSS